MKLAIASDWDVIAARAVAALLREEIQHLGEAARLAPLRQLAEGYRDRFSDDAALSSDLLLSLSYALSAAGEYDAARACSDQLFSLAERSGDEAIRGWGYESLGLALARRAFQGVDGRHGQVPGHLA